MQVRVRERSSQLDRRHRPGLAATHPALSRTPAMIRGHDPNEHAEHLGDQRAITEQADPQPARKRQRPLPVVGGHRQHVVHQMRGTVRHPPAIARTAQAAGLATERYQDLVAARRTHDPCEPSLDHATIEVPTKTMLDVTRQPESMRRMIARSLQHGLQMICDHAIERGRLWTPRPIARRQGPRRSARAAFEYVMRLVRRHNARSACAVPTSSRADTSRIRVVVVRCPNVGHLWSAYRTPWIRWWPARRDRARDQRGI